VPAWLVELYRAHRRELLLAAWSVVRRRDLAEDAVHSAFVGLARLQAPPAEAKPYTFRAVRNAATDLRRRSAARRESPLPEEVPVDRDATSDAELLDAVARSLGSLDDADREVIELHLRASLTFREIGMVLDQPLPTVASRYRRAIEKLRQQMGVLRG